MKENSDGNDTNVGSIGNSIEEDIKILEELRTHGYAMLLMKYEDRIKTNRKIDQALEHIVSDYKKVLKENEELKAKWDKDTHILQNKLDYANADRIDLAQQNKELRKENEGLNNRCRNLDTEAQSYLEELMGDSTLKNRTIKQLNLELEKKEKQIDLMAEQLAGLAIFDIEKDEPLILGDKEEIKQYFKEKVEG